MSRINSMIDSKMKIWEKQLDILKVDVIKANSDKMTEMQKALSIEIDSKLDSAKKNLLSILLFASCLWEVLKLNWNNKVLKFLL